MNINEQNLLAKGFYKYIRFIIYKVVDNDEQWNSYLHLYMKLDW